LNTVEAITAKEADLRSLGDAWADTTTPHGRLMLTVLGGLAEFERDLIRARTSEGRDRAKARGVKARPQTETDGAQEARGDPPPRRARRAGARDRAQLQCLAQHDFKADGVIGCSHGESELRIAAGRPFALRRSLHKAERPAHNLSRH
jgi:DNA invertase Pin-like site-specific DNA recombinase